YLDELANLVQREGWNHRMFVDGGVAVRSGRHGESCLCSDDPHGIRSRCWPREAVLRTGQLVPRRSCADAVHRLALRRAEPGASDVFPQCFTGRLDPRLEEFRFGPATADSGLVEGIASSS